VARLHPRHISGLGACEIGPLASVVLEVEEPRARVMGQIFQAAFEHSLPDLGRSGPAMAPVQGARAGRGPVAGGRRRLIERFVRAS
jgi:hypothetical protein